MSDRAGFGVSFQALAFAGLCAAALPVTAADWPTFAPGQWQIERSIEGMAPQAQKIQRTECMDPSADLAEQREMLGAAGCQFSELTGSGSTFRYTATCKIGGMTSVSESLLEVDGAEGFTITIDSETDGMKTHEVMRAKRLGDCP
jgi:hypothetical protein